FAANKRLASLGGGDVSPDHQRGVDRSDLAVIDMQKAGPADRPTGSMHHHPEDMIEQQRNHAAVYSTIAADMEPAEVASHLDNVGVESAHRPWRQQQTAHSRQLRRSAGRTLPFRGLKRR